MDLVDSIELDAELLDEIRSLAELMSTDLDDYITFLLEEEVLKNITFSIVSDSSIF